MSEAIVEPQGSIFRKIMVVVTVIAILTAFILLAVFMKVMSPKPEIKKKTRPTLAVMAAMAVQNSVRLKVSVQGQARPKTEIDLVPEVSGKITHVSPKFVTGGIFNKGEVLYRIDDADYKVAVIRAKASVARAQQVLTREMAEGAIAKEDWKDLGQGEASALTLRKPQLLEARAGLQSAQADLDNANIRLGRTEVKAPFNGRVRDKFADIGQFVNPGARLGRIFSTNIAEVRLALSDADLARLDLPVAYVAKTRKSAPDVRLSALVGGKLRVWDGKITRTEAAYDPQTRSLYAIAEVTDPYGKGAADGNFPLAPGLFVDAEISGKLLENVITIPRDGLRPEDLVYTVDQEGIAKSNSVLVLDTNMNRAVIGSGIETGQLVIVSPLEKSQISLNFRVLDANDPNITLVEAKKSEEENDATKNEKKNKGDEAKLSKKKQHQAKHKGGK
ncbi:MAG: efflux RND transporter periplasmic adaptor subunit [Robiginitomaculum sp.]